MDDRNGLAEPFMAHQNHLQALAYRMLGSLNEADDALQENWIRLSALGFRQHRRRRGAR